MKTWSHRYSWRLAAAGMVAASWLAVPRAAYAIPAFAAQTGEPCSACHIGFPQLTPYGRDSNLRDILPAEHFRHGKTLPSLLK